MSQGVFECFDAEDVMALLRDYHAAVGRLVVQYSGTLERYAGDGVMVIFNVKGGVAPLEGSLLLGQSFLERFKCISGNSI